MVDMPVLISWILWAQYEGILMKKYLYIFCTYLDCLHIGNWNSENWQAEEKQQEKHEMIAEKSVWKILSTSDVSHASLVMAWNQGLPIQPWERELLLVRRLREAHASRNVRTFHSYPERLAV